MRYATAKITVYNSSLTKSKASWQRLPRGEKMKTIITAEEFTDATENNIGFCTSCCAFTRDNTEPDAEGYDCPSCNLNTVIGAEFALIKDLFELEEEE